LWEVLFEFNNDELEKIVEDAVKKDVQKWMPFVAIENVTVSSTDEEKDRGFIKIDVTFTADSMGISEPQNLTLITPQGNI
jgi:hypothetical protein